MHQFVNASMCLYLQSELEIITNYMDETTYNTNKVSCLKYEPKPGFIGCPVSVFEQGFKNTAKP